jgi:hypothetical protein
MSNLPEFDTLNSVGYLCLRELSEPKDNSLRIVAEEAVANHSGKGRVQPGLPGSAKILTEYSPMESMDGCRAFELFWRSDVAYLVAEKCVGSCGEPTGETYTGTLFRVYTQSHFLDHLARDTGAHTRPIQHDKLTCLNHLLDVACYDPPEIRRMGAISRSAIRIQ